MAIKKYIATIKKIINLSKSDRHFVIDLGENFEYKAGHFVNLSFKEEDVILRRPYSIASNPNNSSEIELCIKRIEGGKLTPKLFEKKKGDEIEIMGPLGLFTLDKATKEKIVFIGTGTGIAPLRSMIKELITKESQKEIILIFGNKFENEILYKEEFENLEKENANFKFVPIVSRPTENWEGRTGHVQENFDVIDPLNSNFFICGLPKMFENVKEKLSILGVDEKEIFHEVFR